MEGGKSGLLSVAGMVFLSKILGSYWTWTHTFLLGTVSDYIATFPVLLKLLRCLTRCFSFLQHWSEQSLLTAISPLFMILREIRKILSLVRRHEGFFRFLGFQWTSFSLLCLTRCFSGL